MQSDEAVYERVIHCCLTRHHVVQVMIITSAKVWAEESIHSVGRCRIGVGIGVGERLSLTLGLLRPVLVVMMMMRLPTHEWIVRRTEAESCTDVVR